MAGLREKSKRRRTQSVLDAADKLFHDQGYSKTTIEQIAETAEVSIGSIYSFFGSKGGIMRALMAPVIKEMKLKGEAVLADPPKRAADAIISFYEAYRFENDWKHVNVLNALDRRTRHFDDELGKLAFDFESIMDQQLGELLTLLKAEGRVQEDLDIDDAVYLARRVLTMHFEEHLLSDGAITYEQALEHAHRRLRLTVRSWT